MILIIVELVDAPEPEPRKTAAQYEAELVAAMEREQAKAKIVEASKHPFGVEIPRPTRRK